MTSMTYHDMLPVPPGPVKNPFMYGKLPDIEFHTGNSFYVHINYGCCAMGTVTAEMFMGTKESHTQLVAKTVMPHCCCNCCRLCCSTASCETIMPVYDAFGNIMGDMQVARDCSCLCCLPRARVYVNGLPGGIVRERCAPCCPCPKTIGNHQVPELYSSKACIKEKICNCLVPCWCLYRGCCPNKTVVEEYYVEGRPEIALEVINVSDL